MAEHHLEFFVISYVPDIFAKTRMNVGIVVFEKQDGQVALAEARFVDMAEITKFDSDADVETLAGTFREVKMGCKTPKQAEQSV